jgi:GNAT superfamily N-acetyltransferase
VSALGAFSTSNIAVTQTTSNVGFMKLRIEPLTPELWPAFEDLFGENGACNGCWCMNWRIGREYQRRPRAANKSDFRALVRKGPPPGLLAFAGDLAVGWCQVTPRSELPHLNRQWRLKPVDDLPVWCISCFFVRKGYRRKGVTSALIKGALSAAKAAGAPALEAYPLDAKLTGSSSWTGFASTFERLGFKTVARHTPARPIMRRMLR